MGIDRYFYAATDLYTHTLDGVEYQCINFDVSFAVLEETYQKFKNSKHITREKLVKYEKELKQKKFN